MDILLTIPLDAETRFILNVCRMSVKVHYLANLLSLDGTKLLPNALTG